MSVGKRGHVGRGGRGAARRRAAVQLPLRVAREIERAVRCVGNGADVANRWHSHSAPRLCTGLLFESASRIVDDGSFAAVVVPGRVGYDAAELDRSATDTLADANTGVTPLECDPLVALLSELDKL